MVFSLGWNQLTNTKIRPVLPCSKTGLCTGDNNYCCVSDGVTTYQLGNPVNIISAWNSAVMDTQRNRLIIWGGGHNDYGGNEVYALNLNASPITLTRLTDPGLPLQQCTGTTANGTQSSAKHTYDQICYIPSIDSMFVFGGAWWCSAGGGTNDLWLFHFATNTWEKKFPTGTVPTQGINCCAEYDPNTGNVYYWSTQALYSYNVSTNVFTQLSSAISTTARGTGIIDPVRKRFLIIGSGTNFWYDIAPGSSYVRQNLVTTGDGGVVTSLQYPGLGYDSVRDKIASWTGGDLVYSLDVPTNTWVITSAYAGGPGPTQYGGRIFHHWNYSVPLNACVVVNGVDQDCYAFALDATPPPPDTTPPTVSITSPTAGATVSATISVTANAADNVAVAGVQFKLDGANLGAEDTAPPYSVSWNTTTIVNGTHTLTAVARDAAGNTATATNVQVNVSNTPGDTTPPTVSLTSPSGGAIVSGTVTLTATAADNVGVAGVTFRVDNVVIGVEDTTSPYSVQWNSATVSNGAHTLTAVARDTSNLTTVSNPISVTVSNTTGTPTANGIIISDTSGFLQTNIVVSIARAFRQGDIAQWAQAVVAGTPVTTQCNIKNSWPDGSMKFGIISFVVPTLAANGTVAVTFQTQSTGNNTGALTQAQMLAATYDFDGVIEMTGASFQSVSARAMLTAGAWTYWLQGPIVTAIILEDKITRAYDKDFGDGSKALHPVFEAWFYPSIQNVELSYIIENVWVGSSAANTTRDLPYSVVLRSGSAAPVARYTQPTFNHITFSNWVRRFWVKTAPGTVNINHNLVYMVTTGAIPHYDTTITPTASLVNTYVAQWTNLPASWKTLPGQVTGDTNHSGIGNWLKALPGAGAANWIGLLHTWETLWLYTFDPRLYDVFMGNHELSGRIPWNMREADANAGTGHFFDAPLSGSVGTQGRVVSVNARRTVTLGDSAYGINCGASYAADRINPVTPDYDSWGVSRDHQPPLGYLPYLITGRYYFLMTLQYEAAYDIAYRVGCYGLNYQRQGDAGYIKDSQIRGTAWGFRSIAYGAFLSPDNTPEQDYFEDKLENNIALWEGERGLTLSYPAKQQHWNFGNNDYLSSNQFRHPLRFWSVGDSGRSVNGSSLGLAGWEEGFMLNALGMARQFGYLTSTLINYASSGHIDMLMDPTSNPYAVDQYTWPSSVSTASGGALFTLWSQFKTYIPSPTSFTSDTTADHGYGFIFLAALSFMIPYTSRENYTGLAAYNYYRANKPDMIRLSTESPKWAITPITVSGGGGTTAPAAPTGLHVVVV